MIKNIRLKNFKAFEDENIELAPLTLITGINGMGKSSVIQSLLLLKQSYEIGYLETKNQVDLSNDFIDLESAESMCYTLATKREIEISLTLDNGNIHTWNIDASDAKKKVLDCTYTGNGDLKEIPLFNENFIFLEAERWGPRNIYYKKEAKAYNTKLGIQGELTPAYLVNAITENETIGIEAMKHPNVMDDSDQLYENLNAWMAEIVNLPLKTRVTEVDESTVKLLYNIEGAIGQSYSALQVGFGLTFCLPIVVALLRAKKGDLLIIENPEAHLHPAAQAKLGLLICHAVKNGVQVILESHSDHILNSVRYSFKQGILTDELAKVMFIRRIVADGRIYPDLDYIKIHPDGKLSHRPEDFFDTWDKMLTSLI